MRLDEIINSPGMFSATIVHETTPQAAEQIRHSGFRPSQTGVFFNNVGTGYSGGEYGGNEIKAHISGSLAGILDLEDEENLPDDLAEFADGEEIADYARNNNYWAWTDGIQFSVLDISHIKLL